MPFIGVFSNADATIHWQGEEPSFQSDTPAFISAVQTRSSFIHVEGETKFVIDIHRASGDSEDYFVFVSTLHTSGIPRIGEYAFESQIMRFMSQSVIVSDLDQRILVWNQAAERIYGWKTEEVLGKRIEDIQLSKTYSTNVQNGFFDRLKTEPEINLEGWHRRKNGDEFPVRIFNSAICDSNGEVYALISITSDITEEKRVESDLFQGKQEIDLLFNNTMYGAFFMMMDEPIDWGPHVDKEAVLDYVFEHQRITRINQAMLDQYRATEDQFIGILPKDFFAHNIEEGREIWRKFFDLGRWRLETDERRMDGTRVIFEGDYFLLTDDQGRIIGHFGVQQDVTERKENEERLRISEKKLKKLTENVPGAIFEFVRDAEGKFFFDFLSAGVAEFDLGVPADELYENVELAFSLIHPEDLDIVLGQLAETKADDRMTFEFRIKTESGGLKWLRSISYTEELENGEMRWYGIFEDTTEEKKQSEELQRLALAAQNTSDYIIICDAEGIVQWFNTNEDSKLGFSKEEILNESFLDRIKQQCNEEEECAQLVQAFFQKEEFNYHLRMFRKDGTVGYIEYRGTPIYNEDKAFIYFLIVERDVTEIYTKQNELVRAISVTKEQNARLREFTYIVSHNVRSHSANFTSLTSLLQREEDESEKVKLIEMLTKVSENLEQTIQHLNSIVSVNEDVTDKYVFVPLKKLIESELDNISQEIEQAGATVDVDVSDDLKIYGVPAYLESIFHNLIHNAIKYRHPERKPIVKINARNSGTGIELVIADNGLGIDLEKYGDKLFGMYRTFHNNKNARGIGLYLTKNQIDAMGATIAVNSEVDKGTIFQLFFPDGFAG